MFINDDASRGVELEMYTKFTELKDGLDIKPSPYVVIATI